MHCTLWTVHRVDEWPVITSRVIPSSPSLGALDGKKKRKTKRKLPPCSSLLRTLLLTPLRHVHMYQHHRPPPFTTPNKKYLSSLVMCRLISCSVLPSQHQKRRVTHILVSHFHFSPQKERERRDGERGHTTPHHLLVHSAHAAQLSSSAKTRPRQKS